jgi:aryl-alcohol dehydrogenase-like predicted oxidoreductase
MGGGDWQYGWGPQDERESIATIHRSVELGINWIDTAPGYGLGLAEQIVGKAVRELRQKPIIATKTGRTWGEERKIFSSLKRESIRAQVEASLRRLQVERIDLCQIHFPRPDEDIEEAWSTLAELVSEGKLAYLGVSNFNVSQLKRLQHIHPITSLQPLYSMLYREVEEELLAFCASNSIGIVAYSPLGKGLLTGRFSAERARSLPPSDHRTRDPLFRDPALGATLRLVEDLRLIAEEEGKTMAQLAVAWVLRRSEVTSAIVGARSPSQIEETAAAGDWRLSEDQLATIEGLLENRLA